MNRSKRKELLLQKADNKYMKRIKERINKCYWNTITKQLDGIGVIEIILILVIIIGLILIFRNQIEAIMKTAFGSITESSTGIEKAIDITPVHK